MAQQVFGDVLKKGEEIFQNVSGKLMETPAVAKAFEAAKAGKSQLDQGMAVALKQMNVQPLSEFRGLKRRVEGLEAQVVELREAVEALKAGTTKPGAVKARATKRAAPKGRAKKA